MTETYVRIGVNEARVKYLKGHRFDEFTVDFLQRQIGLFDLLGIGHFDPVDEFHDQNTFGGELPDHSGYVEEFQMRREFGEASIGILAFDLEVQLALEILAHGTEHPAEVELRKDATESVQNHAYGEHVAGEPILQIDVLQFNGHALARGLQTAFVDFSERSGSDRLRREIGEDVRHWTAEFFVDQQADLNMVVVINAIR